MFFNVFQVNNHNNKLTKSFDINDQKFQMNPSDLSINYGLPEFSLSINDLYSLISDILGLYKIKIGGEIVENNKSYELKLRISTKKRIYEEIIFRDNIEELISNAAEKIYNYSYPYDYALYLFHKTPPDTNIQEIIEFSNTIQNGIQYEDKPYKIYNLLGCIKIFYATKKYLTNDYDLFKQKILESIEDFKKSYNLNNNNYDNLMNLGLIYYFYLHDNKNGTYYFNKAIKIKQDLFTLFYWGSSYLMQTDNIKPVIKKAEKLANKDKSINLYLGLLYLYENQYYKSIQSFSNLLIDNPSNDNGYNGIGMNYMVQTNYKESRNYFYKALKLSPSNQNTLNNISLSYLCETNIKAASSNYLLMLKYDSNSFLAYYGLGYVKYKEKNYYSSLTYLEKALFISPFSEQVYYSMGSNYKELQNTNKAIGYYKKALKINPFLLEAYSNLNMIYENNKDDSNLILLRENFLSNNFDISIANKLIIQYYNLKNYDDAILYSKKIIEKDPTNELAYLNLTINYDGKNDLTNALLSINKLILMNNTTNNNSLFNHSVKGRILSKMEKHKEAIKELDFVTINDTNDILSLFIQAEEAFIYLSNKNLVYKYTDKILKMSPTNKKALLLRKEAEKFK